MTEADDYTSWYLQTHEGMALRELSPPATRILDIFLKTSFLIERKEARVPVLRLLAAAAKLHKGNLSRYLDELEKADVVTEREEDGCFYYAINPDWTMWKVGRRHTYKEEKVMERALHELIEIGKLDPGQIEFSARGFERDDFNSEVSRAFASAHSSQNVVPGTTDDIGAGPEVVPSTTNTAVVPRTTGPPHEGIVPGTTGPALKPLGANTLSSSNAPKAGGAIGAGDPDLELLIERMWRVIPDQRATFQGAWVNRAMRVPRAMRMAVDKFLEAPPAKLRTTTWQWLRAEYIANAHRLGMESRLSEQDQQRRGWWTRLLKVAHLFA